MRRTVHVLMAYALFAACAAPPAPAVVAPPRTATALLAPIQPAVAVATPAGPVPDVKAPTNSKPLPFDPSPDDRPALGANGFTGTASVTLSDGTKAVGPRIAAVKPGSGLEAAGAKAGDVVFGIAGVILRPDEPDPIGKFRELLLTHAPDSEVTLDLWRDGEGLRSVTALLGRQPPPYARIDTPTDWFRSARANGATDDLIRDALALDGGTARYMDILERNRKHAAKRDPLRLREVTEAHLSLAANEPLAIEVATAIGSAASAARVAAGTWRDASAPSAAGAMPDGLPALIEAIAARVAEIDAASRAALASWTEDDRTFFAANFEKLTARVNEGEYLTDDEDPARERANRRIVGLLAKVDRAKVADAASLARSLVASSIAGLVNAAEGAGRDGLIASKDTPFGRIEVWGGGNQKHTNRCAFLFDLSGNDNYLDVAARADLTQTTSIYIDASGDDLWAATSPFGLCGALGGAAYLADLAGDDQYLSRDWSQGAGVAGSAELLDGAGRDVYHAQDLSQGIGMSGAGVLIDRGGDDLYTGSRFCQAVGFPGGVGALVDEGGNDRYVCTGRYDSDYGDIGQYSGWGQGVGFGFRNVASGGIGVLVDARGDDVYESGNFSQGGGYFYAWGILWDAQGKDRYIGSRYAQGFAAHQAVGTFIEGAGDDLYQSHSGVAQGLSWDETSVVFHDLGGNDRYETSGFSLASAAHNGMVLFIDDGGDDVYAGLPAHAGSNEYHGGKSFALFIDRSGKDVYVGSDAAEWNDRAAVRDDGAYHVDLPSGAAPAAPLLR
ncbi:MAG: hypothetical protein K8T90_18900 [Planctomycetes bacterium]|nr:hypothetical protein [Planctomycetota bacterium]